MAPNTKTIIRTLLSLFLILLLFPLHAAVITGTITEDETGEPVFGAAVIVKELNTGTISDLDGKYSLTLPSGSYTLVFQHVGYETRTFSAIKIKEGETRILNVQFSTGLEMLDMVIISETEERKQDRSNKAIKKSEKMYLAPPAPAASGGIYAPGDVQPPDFNTEAYDVIQENRFREVTVEPLSTFSIDVDRAAYANVRRFLNGNQLPPKDAVRIEEMINYFTYDYAQPAGKHPFAIFTEYAECPWNPDHRILHIGLQGKDLDLSKAPASNLVFLLDVSGSMNSPNKLPLLKQAFKMLTDNLRPDDRVAIVVYAGAAGLVLPSTPGAKKDKIMAALDRLEAGGSTAGGEGIKLAYKTAKENFIPGGNNRVILATDGDFNIGASSDAEMVRLIEDKRDEGVFLTVLGFGMGNYKDSKMEKIADNGNGNYAYIDNLREAKKVLVNEMSGTLFTIAKDVKIQIEFNPAQVQAYRLIGYENRLLNKEDFNDDKKDAGELGAGHTVTALYEIIPVGVSAPEVMRVDPLKYQQTSGVRTGVDIKDLATIKLRYKAPESNVSELIELVVKDLGKRTDATSDNLRWAAAVAEFGMLLRDSEYKKDASWKHVLDNAKSAKGKDEEGYRAEFLRLVETAELLSR
jgi:Ca-activated chloride channel family protein